LGYSGHNTETQERLEMQHVVSPEEGVDDDPYEEDPRVDKAHSRIADLTDYLWTIPGFEAYCTTLKDAAREDADLNEHEGDTDSEVDVDSVEAVLDDQVEDDSVDAVPDDHIEAWLDDQIEDWLDIYAGFRLATISDYSSQDLEHVEEECTQATSTLG